MQHHHPVESCELMPIWCRTYGALYLGLDVSPGSGASRLHRGLT